MRLNRRQLRRLIESVLVENQSGEVLKKTGGTSEDEIVADYHDYDYLEQEIEGKSEYHFTATAADNESDLTIHVASGDVTKLGLILDLGTKKEVMTFEEKQDLGFDLQPGKEIKFVIKNHGDNPVKVVIEGRAISSYNNVDPEVVDSERQQGVPNRFRDDKYRTDLDHLGLPKK